MHVVVVLTIATRANKNETGSHAQSRAFTKTAIGGKANASRRLFAVSNCETD
jgi:hypothetical protein